MSNSATVASLQETISLYFRDSRSDKEYHVQIETDGNGYVVNFQYGRYTVCQKYTIDILRSYLTLRGSSCFVFAC